MNKILVFCLLSISTLVQANDTADYPLRLYIGFNQQTHVILIDRKTFTPLSDNIYKQIHPYQNVNTQYIAQAQTNEGTWGYIDTKGKWLNSPLFDEVKAFSEGGVARLKQGDRWGFIKSDGSFLVEPQYYNVIPFNQGFAAIQEKEDDDYYYINLQGEKVFDQTFSNAQMFSDNGLAAIATSPSTPVFEIYLDKVIKSKVNGKSTWGYINNKGETVIEPQFRYAATFNQFNIASVSDNSDNSFIIDTTGKAINNKLYEYLWDFSESGVAWSETIDSKFTGYIDAHGKQVWEASYHDFSGEYNGLLINTGEDYQVYDPFGKLIIKESSTWAFPFTEPGVTIALREHWGLLYKDGRFDAFSNDIIAPLTDQFSRVIGFKDGLIAMINDNREIIYFDKEGQKKYKLAANDKGVMSLFNDNDTLVWESNHPFEEVHSSLASGVTEHFKNNKNNDEEFFLLTIESLLKKEPKRYYVPNLIFDDLNADPYNLESDIDEIRKGAIEIIASTYVSAEEWGSYYYLSDHNSDAFNQYENTLKEVIIKQYGKPDESSYDRTTWKIKDKILSLGLFSDSGDGDFYYQLVLEVN